MLQPTAPFIIAVVPPVNAVGTGALAVMLYDALDALVLMPPTGLQRASARSEVTNKAKGQHFEGGCSLLKPMETEKKSHPTLKVRGTARPFFTGIDFEETRGRAYAGAI